MACVVTRGCIKCRECLRVCPVDAFHESKEAFFIDPKTCLDCGACILTCPVQAIYPQEDLPNALKYFKALNAKNALILPLADEDRSNKTIPR